MTDVNLKPTINKVVILITSVTVKIQLNVHWTVFEGQ